MQASLDNPVAADPSSIPLDKIDVSDPRLYQQGIWQPYFERLRKEAPVHYLSDSKAGPFWSVTRYEDIIEVEHNWEIFSSAQGISLGDVKVEPGAPALEMFVSKDPPQHTVERNAVQTAVAPRTLAQMEDLIRSRVVQILDNLPVGEPFDWVSEVSINLTVQMLATIFDFPFEEREKLLYWTEMMASDPEVTGIESDPQERLAALEDCLATFTRLWHEREGSSAGRYDMLSLMQNNPATSDMVNRPMEFLGNLFLLIIGGNDTTRNSITGGVLALNQNPAEYAKLRADHSLIPGMVSEIVRWQSPLAYMRRTATQDIEFRGQQIKQGDKVLVWYISGNRDETAIEQPDQFIIDRPDPRKHLAFGTGVHRCMGSRLAEMQLRIVWEEIMKRFEFIEVVGEAPRYHSNLIMGFSSMPVVIHPL